MMMNNGFNDWKNAGEISNPPIERSVRVSAYVAKIVDPCSWITQNIVPAMNNGMYASK